MMDNQTPLRAIREYTANQFCARCNHTKPVYVVTFAQPDGLVVAECSFSDKMQADYVVEMLNAQHPDPDTHKHSGEWEAPAPLRSRRS